MTNSLSVSFNPAMDRTVFTIRELVDELGGPTEVARWGGIGSASAVCNWIDRDTIPPAWHLRLLIEASKRGFSIAPSVFGLEPDVADSLIAAAAKAVKSDRLALSA